MADNAQLIEDLKATKVELQTHGRCNTAASGADGSICLVVAVAIATKGLNEMAVFDALRRQLGSFSLVRFNENPTTTDQDVYDLIDKAVANLGGMA